MSLQKSYTGKHGEGFKIIIFHPSWVRVMREIHTGCWEHRYMRSPGADRER